LLPNEEYALIVPWADNRETWESLHCHFTNNHCDFLNKGIYSSDFKQTFCFESGNPSVSFCTIEISFKINLEIY